jgi:hypothetical protein
VEVEGRKGDTTLTGADELYHDEAFRAKASPFPPIFNVNNFSEISICKPENFLTGADELYHDEAFRAKASPFSPILNVNNFFEISICKPENFLNFPNPPYNRPRTSSR